MYNDLPFYGCSGGCRNCPRMRRCCAAAMEAAAPAMAEAPLQEPEVLPGDDTAWDPNSDQPSGLAEFLALNSESGLLRIQAFRGEQAIPLEHVHIIVSRQLDGGAYVFFEGDTDNSGLIDNIPLPAPPRGESLQPGQADPYATYELHASYAQYEPLDTTVDIFENVKTVQPVQLRLRME